MEKAHAGAPRVVRLVASFAVILQVFDLILSFL